LVRLAARERPVESAYSAVARWGCHAINTGKKERKNELPHEHLLRNKIQFLTIIYL